MDFFLYHLLPRFLRFDKHTDIEYIKENNAAGHGVKNQLRFPELLKPYDKLGTFAPPGTYLVFLFIAVTRLYRFEISVGCRATRFSTHLFNFHPFMVVTS